MIKLVATDMDGTFLDESGFFDSRRLHAVLDIFADQGILFVAASGRSLLALELMFEEHAKKMAFIAENGTLVKVREDIIFESQLSKEQYLEVVDILMDSPYMLGHDFLLSGEHGAYLHEKASDDYMNFISNYYENVQRVSDLSEVEDTILKVTANFSGETVRQGEAWFNERVAYAQAVTTGFKSVDIVVRDVNKRTGLEVLCDTFGIKDSEVLAFGDNLNDLEMLEFAGTAIATANARPEIKDISNKIIGTCQEQSVMAYIEGMVK